MKRVEDVYPGQHFVGADGVATEITEVVRNFMRFEITTADGQVHSFLAGERIEVR